MKQSQIFGVEILFLAGEVTMVNKSGCRYVTTYILSFVNNNDNVNSSFSLANKKNVFKKFPLYHKGRNFLFQKGCIGVLTWQQSLKKYSI